MTPFGDNAKFVLVKRSRTQGHVLTFVDGHGYSRVIAESTVTDPMGTELEWLGASAGAFHKIPCHREDAPVGQPASVDAEQLQLELGNPYE